MAIVDSLLTVLGYEFEGDDLGKYADATKKATDLTAKLVKVAVAAATALSGMAIASAKGTDELTKASRLIRIGADDLDALNFAAEQVTGSSDGMASSLQRFSIGISEAARGTGSALEAFGILGVQTVGLDGKLKSVNQLFLESADALNKLSDEGQKLELADKLGLGDISLLLNEGSDGIRRLTDEARELGVITTEDAKAAEEFNDQWNRLVRLARSIVRAFATGVLPIFTEYLGIFKDWVIENKKIISSGILKFFGDLGNALRVLLVVTTSLLALRVIMWVAGIIKAMRALTMATLLAQAAAIALPIAIAAVGIALGLAIDDFMVFMNGGVSVLEDMLEKYETMKTIFEVLGFLIREAHEALTHLFSFLAPKGD